MDNRTRLNFGELRLRRAQSSRRVIFILTVFLLCPALPTADSQADSIWAKRDKVMGDLYADDVARNIGDVLTIMISEDSKVDNKAKRDLKKQVDKSTTFNGELGITTPNNNLLPRIPGFTMAAESTNELKSKADFKDERKFIDRVTVVVVDILPNRNLVVIGSRSRNIAGDIQNIEVSGIVRPSDIAFDNTVKSEQVADFRIVTKNSGISAPYTKPGWLGRIFDIIWPF
jgi:flagellar L-ring protein precursor FlgH